MGAFVWIHVTGMTKYPAYMFAGGLLGFPPPLTDLLPQTIAGNHLSWSPMPESNWHILITKQTLYH